MKNRKGNFGETVNSSISKFIFIIFLLISTLSCTPVQYGFDARENSKFSTFDNLGVSKEDFIKEYGFPTNKGMYQEASVTKVEKLYYTEKVKDFLVTTRFIFVNDILEQMERVETINNFTDTRGQVERTR